MHSAHVLGLSTPRSNPGELDHHMGAFDVVNGPLRNIAQQGSPNILDAPPAEDVVGTFDHITADRGSLGADGKVCDGGVVVSSAVIDLSETSVFRHVCCESCKI